MAAAFLGIQSGVAAILNKNQQLVYLGQYWILLTARHKLWSIAWYHSFYNATGHGFMTWTSVTSWLKSQVTDKDFESDNQDI